MKTKTKSKRKRFDGASRRADSSPSARKRWAPWIIGLTCMMLVGAATYAVFHYVILTRVPRAMVGKWLVVGEEMRGARLEFFRDGRMIGKVNMDGNEGTIKARVEVDGKTLRITSINPDTKKPHTDVHTIRKLTEHDFILMDHKGTELIMHRLR